MAETPLSSPLKANSPINSWFARLVRGICSDAASIPSAIGKSKPLPVLGKLAGPRLTVILRHGNSNWLFIMALRTRSLLSFTAVSASPTIVKLGNPFDKWTSTDTGCATIPIVLRVLVNARLIRFFPYYVGLKSIQFPMDD